MLLFINKNTIIKYKIIIKKEQYITHNVKHKIN